MARPRVIAAWCLAILIQTVLLPDTTTQTENVGDGRFYGAEVAADTPVGTAWRVGGNYTVISRTIEDALQANLRIVSNSA
jgi:iron complex outermembrane receptor protein